MSTVSVHLELGELSTWHDGIKLEGTRTGTGSAPIVPSSNGPVAGVLHIASGNISVNFLDLIVLDELPSAQDNLDLLAWMEARQ